jgi:hypothetical protein
LDHVQPGPRHKSTTKTLAYDKRPNLKVVLALRDWHQKALIDDKHLRTLEPALTLPLLDDDEAESDDAGEGKDDAGPRDSDLDVRSDERPAYKLASSGKVNGENRGTPKSMAQLAAEAEAATAAAQMSEGVLQGQGQGDAEVGEEQEGAASVGILPCIHRRHVSPSS